MKIVESRFFCPNCGKEGLNIYRIKGRQHGKFHRKKMYCPWCKNTLNFIEVRNDQEKEEFLENYKNNMYIEEAKESIKLCRN